MREAIRTACSEHRQALDRFLKFVQSLPFALGFITTLWASWRLHCLLGPLGRRCLFGNVGLGLLGPHSRGS